MTDLATIRLFNAAVRINKPQAHTQKQMKEFLSSGVILDQRVRVTNEVRQAIYILYGKDGDYANKTFHKSWEKVRTAPMLQLIAEQVMHYITTYGFESVGIFDNDLVYIPTELFIPDFYFSDAPLTYIKGVTLDELVELFLNLADGVALGEQTLADLMSIVDAYPKTFATQYNRVGNRELRSLMATKFNIVPTEPVEWLRYVVTELTGESLLIKNRNLTDKLKTANRYKLDALIKSAPANLASIFYRYRVIFAAMKKASGDKAFFNRLNKSAPKMHVPMGVDYLNDITNQIKTNTLDITKLRHKLEGTSNFRKVRLAYALFRRLHSGSSIVYTVRNGRGWATDFEWDVSLNALTKSALQVVLVSLANSMDVKGKTFYIPSDISYAVPATEKTFTGNFPSGTSVAIEENLIVGIYWEDNDERRVDLDLSVVSATGKHGWDGSWRGGNVMFSGDITSAPNGATELFHIVGDVEESRLLMVNDYNFRSKSPVPAKIMVASEPRNTFGRDYMIDPTNIYATANIVVDNKQTVLGVIKCVDGVNRVYFNQVSVGNSITSSVSSQANQVREYLVRSTAATIDLADLLEMAGATVYRHVARFEDDAISDLVDLSPSSLTKTTILDLVK